MISYIAPQVRKEPHKHRRCCTPTAECLMSIYKTSLYVYMGRVVLRSMEMVMVLVGGNIHEVPLRP